MLVQEHKSSLKSSLLDSEALRLRALRVRDHLTYAGLYEPAGNDKERISRHWRIGLEPFTISPQEHAVFNALGPVLHSFMRVCNTLYSKSISGHQPAWISEYLDIGKPSELVSFSRMRRFRNTLPSIIRPDIIPTDNGFVITELDAVPGGFGLTGALLDAYCDTEGLLERETTRNGIINGFADMIRHIANSSGVIEKSIVLAIVVSEEAEDYRSEMTWLATQLRESGLLAYAVTPQEIHFTEEGLRLSVNGTTHHITVLYRFFELFDLKNIPKTELIMYSNKKTKVAVTPPFKAFLEEKMWFALFHHPSLEHYWIEELGEESVSHLQSLIPRTWILDPRPIPPYATIPNLTIAGYPVQNWEALKRLTQKERRFVIKPSGFSPLAWGSRGVSVGHDLSQDDWGIALDQALKSFPHTPFVLQEFHDGRRVTFPYSDPANGSIQWMKGRTRLCPYYFVRGVDVQLGATMATVCPLDKKIIHGMKDAIIVPCAVRSRI
tara:strand:+ start:1486 stop:2967 length:1482 start_codon:yes stop_codon:yes gene_type:complete